MSVLVYPAMFFWHAPAVFVSSDFPATPHSAFPAAPAHLLISGVLLEQLMVLQGLPAGIYLWGLYVLKP